MRNITLILPIVMLLGCDTISVAMENYPTHAVVCDHEKSMAARKAEFNYYACLLANRRSK